MSSSYEEKMKKSNYLPFHLGYITPQMIEKAKKELNENDDTVSSSLQQLRQLILGEKNFQGRTDNDFLLQFLRAKKFDVKRSFDCFKKLYDVFCKSYSDVFSHHDVSLTLKAFRTGFASHLPYRDEDGSPVLLVRTSNWDTSNYDTIGMFNSLTAMVMDAIDEPATQICGVHLLIDLSGLTLHLVRLMTPRYMYLVSKGVKDSIPIRYKAIHLLNASAVFQYIWSVLKIFLTDKIRQRIHFHKDNESLQNFIPKAILPSEYGGDNSEFDPVQWSSRELENFLPKYLEIICSVTTDK